MPETVTLKPQLFAVELSGGTVSENVYVEVRNLSNGEYRILQTNANGRISFNLNDLSDDGTDTGTKTALISADIIEYKIQGGYGYGGGTLTSTTKSTRVKITQTDRSTTNTPGVSI